MVQKRYCDICGAEIPSTVTMSLEEAVKVYSGWFAYGAVVCEESDDLCKDCGAKIRDFIRQLKKETKKVGNTT